MYPETGMGVYNRTLMTLHLGWTLRLPGTLPGKGVQERVEALRRYCLQLPFERISPVRWIHGRGPRGKRNADLPIWSGIHVPVSGSPLELDRIEADEAVAFSVWPGPGAESGWLGAARHSQDDPRVRAETRGGWYGRGHLKTLYAAHPRAGGLAHFLKCHIALVAALDEAARLGFDAEVRDDGQYWESRDVDALLARLRESEHRVAAVVGRLTDLLADRVEGTVVAPMTSRPDFERVEAGARPPPAPPWDDVVLDLIRRTGGLRQRS